jgi:membrane glycosyltransferase
VFLFFSLAVLIAGIGSLLFADLLWRMGWSAASSVLLVLFAGLLFLASVGCVHGVYGFVLRRFGDQRRITALGDYQGRSIAGASTALVFGIHNENARAVCESLRTIYESIAATGEIENFDFFILSDSTRLEVWMEEERCWFAIARELNGLNRIFYRRRKIPVGRKSGNIRDFLNVWGRRYRYFIVLDADSIMNGATVVDLVRLMETHPKVGLIQTSPAVVNARSAFARFQQFANRLYGDVYHAGLNYWSQDGGNYWGHNAIIRTEPFMEFCDLPELPGRKPFGGQILSHDFVEAALLRKEDWEVWFAYDLPGSYEEGPPDMIENAQRDRRWCQGNLQHAMLLFARGFRGVSRLHLSMGILGYLAGPLWLLFLLTSTYMLGYQRHAGLSEIAVAAFTPFLRLTAAHHALLVFGLSMGVVLLPKFLSILDLFFDEDRRAAFGGLGRTTASVFVETLFSTLHAPVQMFFHTEFILATFLGIEVRWTNQQRLTNGTSWTAAFRRLWLVTVIGISWGALLWRLDPHVFWWFTPILAGLAFSIPLAVFTSRDRVGTALQRAGLLLTPEEASPPPELVRLRARLEASPRQFETAEGAIVEAIRDPYLNAIHVSLLNEQREASVQKDPDIVTAAAEKLLHGGPRDLGDAEQLAVVSNADVMARLHREYWLEFEQTQRRCAGD